MNMKMTAKQFMTGTAENAQTKEIENGKIVPKII